MQTAYHFRNDGGGALCLVLCARGADMLDTSNQRRFTFSGLASRGNSCHFYCPRLAVVCMQYGAKAEAQCAIEAGVHYCLWFAVDILEEHGNTFLLDVLLPLLTSALSLDDPLVRRESMLDIQEKLKDCPVNHGLEHADADLDQENEVFSYFRCGSFSRVAPVSYFELSSTALAAVKQNLTQSGQARQMLDESNMMLKPSLQNCDVLRVCDLKCVEEGKQVLEAVQPQHIHITPPPEVTEVTAT